ncbi:FAS1-like dehydratase domain-containing protein [Xylophilus sp.]|uniref:FAS1-like dehydratase domain-containing protein n=1 Tax=Xylophilus sp. TaxID=2653893 RepID=UPI0013BD77B5|nr:MaoC family dehydratase N-terminal domain-containing protein [Xylophilus sp.]KAF1045542.1 MAG: Mesaconyl-C(4)-CoA hydratase [Xylophilus sp.]
MALLTEDILRRKGASLQPLHFEVTRSDIRKYAVATGQREERFLRGDEAPLLFLFGALMPITPLAQLRADGHPPDDPLIPALPLERIMAGGSEYEVFGAIRPGDALTVRRTLKDIYEKEGSQGPLIFLVIENRFERAGGEAVAVERLTRIAR